MSNFEFDTTGMESYVPNVEAESVKGVWIPFPHDREFLILRAGGSNKAFIRAHQAALRPYRRQIEKNTMDDDVLEQLARETYSHHVIKDWRGMKDPSGNSIPYSPEACQAFLKAYPEAFKDILQYSADISVFNEAILEEAKDVLGEP